MWGDSPRVSVLQALELGGLGYLINLARVGHSLKDELSLQFQQFAGVRQPGFVEPVRPPDLAGREKCYRFGFVSRRVLRMGCPAARHVREGEHGQGQRFVPHAAGTRVLVPFSGRRNTLTRCRTSRRS